MKFIPRSYVEHFFAGSTIKRKFICDYEMETLLGGKAAIVGGHVSYVGGKDEDAKLDCYVRCAAMTQDLRGLNSTKEACDHMLASMPKIYRIKEWRARVLGFLAWTVIFLLAMGIARHYLPIVDAALAGVVAALLLTPDLGGPYIPFRREEVKEHFGDKAELRKTFMNMFTGDWRISIPGGSEAVFRFGALIQVYGGNDVRAAALKLLRDTMTEVRVSGSTDNVVACLALSSDVVPELYEWWWDHVAAHAVCIVCVIGALPFCSFGRAVAIGWIAMMCIYQIFGMAWIELTKRWARKRGEKLRYSPINALGGAEFAEDEDVESDGVFEKDEL